MMDELWQYLQFNAWRSLISLGAGLAVVAPCLLVPSWRRKILRFDVDIETVGLVALIVLLVAVACHNNFVIGNGG